MGTQTRGEGKRELGREERTLSTVPEQQLEEQRGMRWPWDELTVG